MPVNKNTFIVSDESINFYGFRILTSGINITGFAKNPVMFYMHERDSGIIGRWDNIRVENGQLLADAVFDETIELGQQVKTRVEGGFLRSASIGIENAVKQDLNGVQTVIKCDLKEISIVDMPSNMNAVKLFHKSGRCVYRLADLEVPDTNDLRTAILSLLNLPYTATDADLLEAVRMLQNDMSGMENELDVAIACGYLDAGQRSNFRAMALSNRSAFNSYIELRRNEMNTDMDLMLNEAVGKGKIIAQDKLFYKSIGEKLGIPTLRQLLNTLYDAVKPTDFINCDKDRSAWSLNDYRKFAPHELRDNPALYDRLVEKEKGAPEASRTLEYYRRNNPEHLRNNPELYERLVKENKI